MLLSIAAMIAWAAVGLAQTASREMIPNGGFERGLEGWTAWGRNADLITIDSVNAHSGKQSARIRAGHNALYTIVPMRPGQAYQIRFFYRLAGTKPNAEVALNYSARAGGHRSAGFKIIPVLPGKTSASGWTEIRQVVMPTPTTVSCQIAFTAKGDTEFWVDDVSVRPVPRPAGLKPPPAPWDGLKHRTSNPLFRELLTNQPGGYTMVAWGHNLNFDNLPESRKKDFPDAASWEREVERSYIEAARSGLGYMDLPGGIKDESGPRSAAFHKELHENYGVRFDVWTEGSASTAAALNAGAELLNPRAVAIGRKHNVSLVDPRYVQAQEKILTRLAASLRGHPFVGVYYGRDEPSIDLPEGSPDRWGDYGKQMAAEVLKDYGFAAPVPDDPSFENDPNKPLRWIAYNRWASDKWAESRAQLHSALHGVDPNAVYSPADYWFMSGFHPFDYPALASCTDLFDIDPYASSAERRRGRGVYNHGFGAKFMSDLTNKPVRVIAQAFDYAGYTMSPQDLREWVSDAMRCGASAICYYQMDNPKYKAPDRWAMMLHLSKVISTMNRIALPQDPDTAVLYASYTHMAMGPSTPGDQVYAAHALIGEMAGSWFRFVSDSQLDRGQRNLGGYKAVYLPVGKYMTAETAARIEAYVRGGGVLICGDAEAFGSDLAGNDTSKTREQILGIAVLGPAKADKIILTRNFSGGRMSGVALPLFDIELWGESSPGHARNIRILDPGAKVLARYPDGRPAVVLRRLGKGKVITFAANPFSPEVTVEQTRWVEAFKMLQKDLGCSIDRPIWRFVLPDIGGR